MDSLDAQCLLIQVVEGQLEPPDIWRHSRSGSLSCAYENRETIFTWPTGDVAEMARRWRDSGRSEVPVRLRPFLETHRRLAALAGEAGLGPADVVIHRLGRAELRAEWGDERLVLVVDEIGRVSD
jgi:hypothetical protein